VKFSELEGKRVALWGLGRETRALQGQLERRLPSTEIIGVLDDQTPAQEAEALLDRADVLVRSPGVSIYKPLIRHALSSGVTVTTATGLWLAERGGRQVIGVTGTKGKSTTATVIAHLLGQVGEIELAGNIGRPVIDLLGAPAEVWVVCELSSYQIADLTVGPEVAVLTNLYREHTDWHGSEAQYRADKLRLFALPGVRAKVGVTDALEVAGDDPPAVDAPGWHLDADGSVCLGETVVLTPNQIPLRGRHNAQNVATALEAITAAGLPIAPLPDALEGLAALPHRLQTVCSETDSVEWVDDSIATTPESTIAALRAFSGRPVVLIAGGQDRDQEMSELARLLGGRAEPTALILLPDTGARLGAEASAAGLPQHRISQVHDMREAVALARASLTAGTVVLLSPAAPSYNAYRDFEERGEHFAALARAVALPT
jgi:UDP-N-acetylmuramoylalanine--D-glutamate ligase